MIVDLNRFIKEARPCWSELEAIMQKIEKDLAYQMPVKEIRRFHYLYTRVSSDLTRLSKDSSQVELQAYLESIIARAYGYIHGGRSVNRGFSFYKWFFAVFPQTFRRHIRAFYMSCLVFIIGSFFGGGALLLDQDSKEHLMPFPHLQVHPSERVAWEESRTVEDSTESKRGSFSSQLMTHNTKVSILTMSLGMTAGIGTIIMLFYNGVIMGAVGMDFTMAGELTFLFGWLLPHGAVEIPAILLAGQGGLILARAMIGWGDSMPFRSRFRKVSADVVTLIAGVAIMLIWAGLVESFLSQFHEPLVPYWAKIMFGVIEFIFLIYWLSYAGRVLIGGKKT